MRNEHKGDSQFPGGNAQPQQAVAEKEPVAGHEDELEGPSPPGVAKAGRSSRKQVEPRQQVEVESSNAHNWVVSPSLHGDGHVCCSVPVEVKVVV